MTSSTIFYCLLCPSTGISQCSLIISTLNLSSLGTYTFSSLYMILSTSLYSLSLNIFTPAYFIFLTALIILLSFTFDHLTSSNKSTPSIIISTFFVFLTSCYQQAVNVLSDHPRWMFKKNSIEFFVELDYYLYYSYSSCTTSPQSHVLPECSVIT